MPGSNIYRTATLRFANFCDPLASPGSTLADVASAGGGKDVPQPSRALASLVEQLSADEAGNRRACDDILASCPVLQLLRPSLGGSARCCVLAFVGDTEDTVDHTVYQLQLMKTFTTLQNTPVSRGQTSTLLQELREEKARLCRRTRGIASGTVTDLIPRERDTRRLRTSDQRRQQRACPQQGRTRAQAPEKMRRAERKTPTHQRRF